MSSMFKKKTGPSIKPKFVPRGRPAAASSATPAPPTALSSASPTPQPAKPVEAPAQRVPSPRAQRRASATEVPKAPVTSPRQSRAGVTHDRAPPRGTVNPPAAPSAGPSQQQPQSSTAATSETSQVGAPSAARLHKSGDAVAGVRSGPTPTQSQQPAASAPSATPTPTETVPSQEEGSQSAKPGVSLTPQQSTNIRPTGLGIPTPSTQQPVANAESSPSDVTSVSQAAPEPTLKPTPTRRPRKRASAPETASQPENEPIDSIEPASQPKKRTRQRKTQPQSETPDGAAEDTEPKPKRQRKKRQNDDGEEAGEGEARRRQSRQSRPRSLTPPGAEEEMVDIQKLKMSDLTRDLRIGKKFSRHDELRDRERRDRARRSSVDPKASSQTPAPSDARPSPGAPSAAPAPAPLSGARAPAGPQFQIVNGQIVVDQSSLVMDRHARDAIDGPIEEIEENEFTHKVTSNSYRTGSKLRGPNHWSAEDTEKFYDYLAMHGTDFSIITSLFPGRQRRHIKMKFNREEKFQRQRIDAVLIGPKTRTMGFEEYRRVTGREYEPTEDVQAELDRDNEEREAAMRAKEEADARENQERLDAIHGTAAEEVVKK